MVDLEVYQRAGAAVRRGEPIYEDGGTRLVFTYPPFAALVAAVVAPIRGWWGQFLWTVATIAALAGVVWLSFRPLFDRCRSEWRPLAVGAVLTVAVLSHPMIEHVFYGQVNVFLVLLCLLDVLARNRRWPLGVLTGVATALKLTPGVFIVYFLVTDRRRAALTATATAVACTAVAALVVPSASVDFWTREVFEGERIAGAVGYTSNQSLLGVAARLAPNQLGTALWLLLAVAVAGIGSVRARDAFRSGDERGGVALMSLLAVLLSPIAWIHHFVWFVPALGAIVADGRDRRRLVVAAVIAAVLCLRLPWWGWALLDEGAAAGPLGVVLHNAYALLALGVLIAYPTRAGSDRDVPITSAHGRARRNRTGRALPAGS